MTVAGAVFVAVLGVYAAMQTSSMVLPTTQSWIRATASIGGSLEDPVINGSYSNLGNGTGALRPVGIPLVQIGGALFALGPGEIVGNIINGGNGLNVSAVLPNASASCQPTLSLAKPSSRGFAIIDGMKPFGPSVVAAVFAGTASWPTAGFGLMLEPGLSSLFAIQLNETNRNLASVAYDNYSLAKRAVVGHFAESSSFPFNYALPFTMTLSLNGLGEVTVLVDGIPRLNQTLRAFDPFPASAAVWSTSNSSVLGIVSQVALTTQWMGTGASCGFLVSLPIVSNALPAVVSNSTPTKLAGPLFEPVLPAGSLYVLEMLQVGSQTSPEATLANCTSVSLDSNATMAFSAPLEV